MGEFSVTVHPFLECFPFWISHSAPIRPMAKRKKLINDTRSWLGSSTFEFLGINIFLDIQSKRCSYPYMARETKFKPTLSKQFKRARIFDQRCNVFGNSIPIGLLLLKVNTNTAQENNIKTLYRYSAKYHIKKGAAMSYYIGHKAVSEDLSMGLSKRTIRYLQFFESFSRLTKRKKQEFIAKPKYLSTTDKHRNCVSTFRSQFKVVFLFLKLALLSKTHDCSEDHKKPKGIFLKLFNPKRSTYQNNVRSQQKTRY